MFKTEIDEILNKFEDIKAKGNDKESLLHVEWETEDLLSNAIKLSIKTKDFEERKQLNALIKEIKQHLFEIQGLIEKEISHTF